MVGLDVEAATLRVNRQLQRMRRDSENDAPGTLAFSKPKNASRRTVDLSSRAIQALRSHRKRQMEEQLRAGAAWRDHGLVFATTVGTPLDAPNIVNRHFKPLLKRSELSDICWHDLRHTYATLLLAKGVHPKYVQTALGHASIQLTRDTCSHWMPSMGRDTAGAIDDVLEGEHDASPSGALVLGKGRHLGKNPLCSYASPPDSPGRIVMQDQHMWCRPSCSGSGRNRFLGPIRPGYPGSCNRTSENSLSRHFGEYRAASPPAQPRSFLEAFPSCAARG
jgi:hypothetical protein